MNPGMDRPRVTPARGGRRRIALIVAAGAGVAAIAAALMLDLGHSSIPTVDASTVLIDTVKRGDLAREIRGSGKLVWRDTRWLNANFDARVERLLLKPGASVDAGTVVVQLENPEIIRLAGDARAALQAAEADFTAQRLNAETQLLDQKARLAQTNAESEMAKAQVAAESKIAELGIVSKLQFQKSQLAAAQWEARMTIEWERYARIKDSVQAQVKAQSARVAQYRASYGQRARDADSLSVRAGMKGIIQAMPLQEGQRVTAGTNLARIANPDVIEAEIRVSEVAANEVHPGMPAIVDLRSSRMHGRVKRVDPVAAGGQVQVDVELDGPIPSGARADLNVEGSLLLDTLQGVLYIARPPGAEPGQTIAIFRLDASSRIAQRVQVSLGPASATHISVTRGLSAGDQVVVSEAGAWSSSDKVRFR